MYLEPTTHSRMEAKDSVNVQSTCRYCSGTGQQHRTTLIPRILTKTYSTYVQLTTKTSSYEPTWLTRDTKLPRSRYDTFTRPEETYLDRMIEQIYSTETGTAQWAHSHQRKTPRPTVRVTRIYSHQHTCNLKQNNTTPHLHTVIQNLSAPNEESLYPVHTM